MTTQVLYWAEIHPFSGEIIDCAPYMPGIFVQPAMRDPEQPSIPIWEISMTFAPRHLQ